MTSTPAAGIHTGTSPTLSASTGAPAIAKAPHATTTQGIARRRSQRSASAQTTRIAPIEKPKAMLPMP